MPRDDHKTARYRRAHPGRSLLVVAAVLLAACGSDAEAADDAGPDVAPRVVETEMGEVEVPADPQRLLALDEYTALNLMAIGIEPDEVFATYQSEVGAELIEDAGITLTPASMDTSVDIDAIVAAEPDLIVLTAEDFFLDGYDDMAEIAPTVVLPYSKPWREVATEAARLFDRTDTADALVAVLEGRIEELSVTGTGAGISMVGHTYGAPFAPSNLAPIAQLLDDVGYERPAAQAEADPDPTYEAVVSISEEGYADHDADTVVVPSGAYYDADAITSSPAFRAIPAAREDRVVTVDGDMWFATYPFAVWWILDDIEAIQGGDPDGIGTVEDTDARWAAFEAAAG